MLGSSCNQPHGPRAVASAGSVMGLGGVPRRYPSGRGTSVLHGGRGLRQCRYAEQRHRVHERSLDGRTDSNPAVLQAV